VPLTGTLNRESSGPHGQCQRGQGGSFAPSGAIWTGCAPAFAAGRLACPPAGAGVPGWQL